MALPKFKEILGSAAVLSLVFAPVAAADAQQVAGQRAIPVAQQVSVPLVDRRDNGENSVRFQAAQFTRTAPTVVLLGIQRENWPRIRDAIQTAVAQGYKVEGIFMGPTDAQPALEIYAHGTLATNPINPNSIEGPRLTAIIQRISREQYPTALASRMSYSVPSQDQ